MPPRRIKCSPALPPWLRGVPATVKGKALLPLADGGALTLEPGRVLFMDGAESFNPSNPFADDFEMLIHLVKR